MLEQKFFRELFLRASFKLQRIVSSIQLLLSKTSSHQASFHFKLIARDMCLTMAVSMWFTSLDYDLSNIVMRFQ